MANEDKATRYHRLKRRAEILSTLAAAALLLALLLTGGGASLRELASLFGTQVPFFEDALTVAAFALILILLLYLLELPFAYYQGFVLEHRYGLSNETPGQWVRDQMKGLALAVVFGVAGISIVYL